jgi:hypothetical protein
MSLHDTQPEAAFGRAPVRFREATDKPLAATAITEVMSLCRGVAHSTTIRGDRTSSGIHVARERHPHCTVLQVRKWVANACTGTGGGMSGSSGVNAS